MWRRNTPHLHRLGVSVNDGAHPIEAFALCRPDETLVDQGAECVDAQVQSIRGVVTSDLPVAKRFLAVSIDPHAADRCWSASLPRYAILRSNGLPCGLPVL